MSKETQKPIFFSINKIELIEKSLNVTSDAKISTEKDKLKFKFGSHILLSTTKSTAEIILNYSFLSNESELLSIKVRNEYFIKEFSFLAKDGELTNKNFLAFLVDLSIGHLRGIQSTIIHGTPLDNFYMPPISRTKLLAQINNTFIEKKEDEKKVQ